MAGTRGYAASGEQISSLVGSGGIPEVAGQTQFSFCFQV
jgi:hypothetical protein